MDFAEEVYDALIGERIEPIPGVVNAFANGRPCFELYREACAYCESLRSRLGVRDEDMELEQMMQVLWMLQRQLCVEMFHLGERYALRNCE